MSQQPTPNNNNNDNTTGINLSDIIKKNIVKNINDDNREENKLHKIYIGLCDKFDLSNVTMVEGIVNNLSELFICINEENNIGAGVIEKIQIGGILKESIKIHYSTNNNYASFIPFALAPPPPAAPTAAPTAAPIATTAPTAAPTPAPTTAIPMTDAEQKKVQKKLATAENEKFYKNMMKYVIYQLY